MRAAACSRRARSSPRCRWRCCRRRRSGSRPRPAFPSARSASARAAAPGCRRRLPARTRRAAELAWPDIARRQEARRSAAEQAAARARAVSWACSCYQWIQMLTPFLQGGRYHLPEMSKELMMNTILPAPARLAAVFLAAALLCMSIAHAQERRERREHERERFHTSHWVFDDRFHHNHYYTAVGYAVEVLPAGDVVVNFRSGRLWFHSGVWFQQAGPRFVVVRPPVGIVVPVLPPAYSTVYVAGMPYYYANDVYYIQQPGGYAVAEPPMVASQNPPPPAPAPQPGNATPPGSAGNWYYCESAKAYYPYVTECKEGWRSVPATPPQ